MHRNCEGALIPRRLSRQKRSRYFSQKRGGRDSALARNTRSAMQGAGTRPGIVQYLCDRAGVRPCVCAPERRGEGETRERGGGGEACCVLFYRSAFRRSDRRLKRGRAPLYIGCSAISAILSGGRGACSYNYPTLSPRPLSGSFRHAPLCT